MRRAPPLVFAAMRRLVILLTVGSLLVLPPAALAQSAGDEQYSDPFSQADQPNGSQGQQGTQTSEPTAPAQTTQTSQAPAETAQDPAPGPSLPATGLPLGLLAGTGLLLLAGGTTLRRQLS